MPHVRWPPAFTSFAFSLAAFRTLEQRHIFRAQVAPKRPCRLQHETKKAVKAPQPPPHRTADEVVDSIRCEYHEPVLLDTRDAELSAHHRWHLVRVCELLRMC
jgi:hypothetical protein